VVTTLDRFLLTVDELMNPLLGLGLLSPREVPDMGLLHEAAEAIKGVAAGVEHVRTIATAIRDGRDYLKLTHPETARDLSAMCAEMRNTLTAIAAASAILTHFHVSVAGSAIDSKPRAFNDHLVAHKEKAQVVMISLHAMRGHCPVIKQHVERLRTRAKSLNLERLLLLFGIDSVERDRAVADSLQDLQDEEMQAYRLAGQLSLSLQLALNDISHALGLPAAVQPENVPAAAALLGAYADAFGRLESTSSYVALELQQSIDVLEGRV
jgi:hypothetical protein